MSPNANKNKTPMALNVPANKSIKFVSYGFAEVLMSATEKQTRLRHHENNLDLLQLQFINKNNKIKLPCSFVRTDLHLLSNLFFFYFSPRWALRMRPSPLLPPACKAWSLLLSSPPQQAPCSAFKLSVSLWTEAFLCSNMGRKEGMGEKEEEEENRDKRTQSTAVLAGRHGFPFLRSVGFEGPNEAMRSHMT